MQMCSLIMVCQGSHYLSSRTNVVRPEARNLFFASPIVADSPIRVLDFVAHHVIPRV